MAAATRTQNLSLRYAVDEAKAANMPKDTIERAIKKGAGELDGQSYESCSCTKATARTAWRSWLTFLTDNRKNRTVPEMRIIFNKFGGNLGATGCVATSSTARVSCSSPRPVPRRRR